MNFVNRSKEQRKGIPTYTEKPHQVMIRNSGTMYNKMPSCQLIFGAALLVFGLIFFSIPIDLGSKAFWGFGMLLVPVVIRIGMECAMISKKEVLADEALRYHKAWKNIHFFVTPFLFATYIYGFEMLLSFFEHELLKEFQGYIIPSFRIIILGLAALIGVEIKRELDILQSMIADYRTS